MSGPGELRFEPLDVDEGRRSPRGDRRGGDEALEAMPAEQCLAVRVQRDGHTMTNIQAGHRWTYWAIAK